MRPATSTGSESNSREAQWKGLADHAREKGLIFLSSPFSREAVDLLTRVGMAMWKVGSGEVSTLPMLDAMIATGRPILLSSGMSDLAELDKAVDRVRRANVPLAVLQCTTAYPCPPERIGLNMIPFFRERYELLRRPVRSLRHDLSRASRRPRSAPRSSKCT